MSQFGGLFATYPTIPTRYSGSTITPALVQALSNYLTGWTGAAIGGNSPAIEDMNSLCFLFSYQIAYGFQAGIPEYDAATPYYTNSFCQSAGIVYQSSIDNNTGHIPGTYLFTVTSANATAGATYTNNGQTFTVVTTISGATALITTGTGVPAASGTLTKASGTGDSTITFSAYVAPWILPWVTRPNLPSVGQQISSSCGSFSTTSASFVDVTNLSVSITTTGRPVIIMFVTTTTSGAFNGTGSSNSGGAFFQILRGATVVYSTQLLINPVGSGFTEVTAPPGILNTIDFPPAGTYTYKLQAAKTDASAGAVNIIMVAYEL